MKDIAIYYKPQTKNKRLQTGGKKYYMSINADEVDNFKQNIEMHFNSLVKIYAQQNSNLTGAFFIIENEPHMIAIGSCMNSTNYTHINYTACMSKHITLEQLFDIIDPYQDIQLVNAKTSEYLTSVTYYQSSDEQNAIELYKKSIVHGISCSISNKQIPFLIITLDVL